MLAAFYLLATTDADTPVLRPGSQPGWKAGESRVQITSVRVSSGESQ